MMHLCSLALYNTLASVLKSEYRMYYQAEHKLKVCVLVEFLIYYLISAFPMGCVH